MDRLNNEYGKFVIAFENICYSIRASIISMCQEQGVLSNEHIYIEILLEGLTAAPLIKKFLAIYITKYTKSDPILPEVQKLKNIFVDLYEIRNSLAHGTTFLGDPHANLDNFMLQHPKINAAGYYSNVAIMEIKSMTILNIEVAKLEQCFILIKRIISARKAKKDDQQFFDKLKQQLNSIEIKLKPISKSLQI